MNHVVRAVNIPRESAIREHLEGADFYDAFAIGLNRPDSTALEIYLRLISRTPRWVKRAMSIRNRVVALAGVRNVNGMQPADPAKSAAEYRVGDNIGAFRIESLSDDEVMFVIRDTHLDTRCSVLKRTENGIASMVLSSVVHIHNVFGHAYMVVVGPGHKLVTRAMLKDAGL